MRLPSVLSKPTDLPYNENNQIIGSIVRSGYALDNNGKYLGFVTYNGEVVNKNNVVGHLQADGLIAGDNGELIGYVVDFAATATDLNGKYLGRIMPEGKLARSRDIIGSGRSPRNNLCCRRYRKR